MFSWLHNTAIKKWASHLFETNASRPIDFKLSEVIQPTVLVQPYIDVVRNSSSSGTTTLFTTPTDKEFYLTNVVLEGYSESGVVSGEVSFEFVTYDGVTRQISIATDNTAAAGSVALSVPFPMRGVLLAKSSNVTITITNGSAFMAGYTASDRA